MGLYEQDPVGNQPPTAALQLALQQWERFMVMLIGNLSGQNRGLLAKRMKERDVHERRMYTHRTQLAGQVHTVCLYTIQSGPVH